MYPTDRLSLSMWQTMYVLTFLVMTLRERRGGETRWRPSMPARAQGSRADDEARGEMVRVTIFEKATRFTKSWVGHILREREAVTGFDDQQKRILDVCECLHVAVVRHVRARRVGDANRFLGCVVRLHVSPDFVVDVVHRIFERRQFV